MRMRKKKHLYKRLEKVSNYFINVKKDIPNVKEAILQKDYLNLCNIFGNENEICIEVGCGKGEFISEMAKQNPDKNFIAIEMIENIIMLAAEKAASFELKNVRFINVGAEYLERYFKDQSISEIYLNFSPPYPQKSYEGRRLTNNDRVKSYKNILKNGGIISMKTDDKGFFDYTKDVLTGQGFSVTDYTGLDDKYLPSSLAVKTEYETKFMNLGITINRLTAKK